LGHIVIGQKIIDESIAVYKMKKKIKVIFNYNVLEEEKKTGVNDFFLMRYVFLEHKSCG